jgi:hypothetical protein
MKALLLLLPVLALAAGDGPITVMELKGTVKGTDRTGFHYATAGKTFLPEVFFITEKDDSTVLWLANGTKLTLLPGSEVTVKTLKLVGDAVPVPADGKSIREPSPSFTEITVEKGKVIGDVKKLANESVFILKTPVGTVKIKGTVFAVEFLRNKDGTTTFNVGCARGLVQVEMPGVKGLVAVKPGMQLSMSAPAQPPSKADTPTPAPAKPDAEIKPSQSTQSTQAPAPVDSPPPPPVFKMVELPPTPEVTAAIVSHGGPPPPPANQPAPPPPSTSTVIDNIEKALEKSVLTASPTGG